MSNIAIKAENLSKAYQLGQIGTGTISRDLERWYARVRGKEDPFLKIGETNDRTSKGSSDIVWSLKDINFEIEQGDAVGIIGRNGAGKSTLLKVLSRVTSPTTGRITGKGRIASLLEVGTGFHPELTGRENIYLNGTILGMRKKEITRKFDEIVDFAGVERYIDTPVKRYSSGMYVRLAFAVAAHLESEILIVDEVLAVGDAEFQKKCLGKMGEVSKGEGRTVLFVSHNMGSVKQLCEKAILLEYGNIKGYENSTKIVEKYLSDRNTSTNKKQYDDFLTYIEINQHSSHIRIDAEYKSKIKLDIPHLGFIIKNSEGTPIFASNPTLANLSINQSNPYHGKIHVDITEPKLIDGVYNLSIWFGDSKQNFIEDIDALSFEIIGMTENKQYNQSLTGNISPNTNWIFK
ncbi:ABC transporter related protein [Pseudopedobacter saltans DSM 12145]|uniref:ABC transporter related protein n=1 Tax=Pseudopedobacter saltans (strain ATCC 51119 / DSM 12145 / JCM 21818 / CCUG 39354 / LMG 10337 / NBRC 100064 / NCIMB 13643) TaxID=762903 RepID=F0SD77_PSESL|nr:ABC transporter ATP-binding protein [Pseudopedobacter saltans]ADY52863.1 ABC transporter related protein [Pseudopedobacter saltans DSM 12145]